MFYRAPPEERRIYRLDLQTRGKDTWKELPRLDAQSEVNWVVTTGDGQAMAYTYSREQHDLYLAKGLW